MRGAWLGCVSSGLDWESRCPCWSEVAKEKQRWPKVEREEALWKRLERNERCVLWLTLLTLGLTAFNLKWVMCSAHEPCLCVSFCAWHLSLFVAVPPNIFGGNPCPLINIQSSSYVHIFFSSSSAMTLQAFQPVAQALDSWPCSLELSLLVYLSTVHTCCFRVVGVG